MVLVDYLQGFFFFTFPDTFDRWLYNKVYIYMAYHKQIK
jgi:hypothetical protein